MGGQSITEQLDRCKGTPRIDIWSTVESIGSPEVQRMCERIRHDPKLRTLTLKGIKWTEPQVRLVGDALKENTTITSVELDQVSQATTLAAAIAKSGMPLESVTIHRCFNDTGCESLADLIRSKTQLSLVNLDHNFVLPRDCKYTPEAWKKGVIFSGPQFKLTDWGKGRLANFDENAAKVISALANSNVLSFSIRGTDLGPGTEEAIAALLKENNTLLELAATSPFFSNRGEYKSLDKNAPFGSPNRSVPFGGIIRLLPDALNRNTNLVSLEFGETFPYQYNCSGSDLAQILGPINEKPVFCYFDGPTGSFMSLDNDGGKAVGYLLGKYMSGKPLAADDFKTLADKIPGVIWHLGLHYRHMGMRCAEAIRLANTGKRAGVEMRLPPYVELHGRGYSPLLPDVRKPSANKNRQAPEPAQSTSERAIIPFDGRASGQTFAELEAVKKFGGIARADELLQNVARTVLADLHLRGMQEDLLRRVDPSGPAGKGEDLPAIKFTQLPPVEGQRWRVRVENTTKPVHAAFTSFAGSLKEQAMSLVDGRKEHGTFGVKQVSKGRLEIHADSIRDLVSGINETLECVPGGGRPHGIYRYQQYSRLDRAPSGDSLSR